MTPRRTGQTGRRRHRHREHGAHQLHGRASAGELVEVAVALGVPPELLVDRQRHRVPPVLPPRPASRPTEVYAALWLGALMVAAGELPDPFPPPIEELALAYFERFPPDAKA